MAEADEAVVEYDDVADVRFLSRGSFGVTLLWFAKLVVSLRFSEHNMQITNIHIFIIIFYKFVFFDLPSLCFLFAFNLLLSYFVFLLLFF